MKVIYSVDWLTRLSVWISPLVPSWRCFLPHVDFFILTSHFTPLIVSPPLLSSHSPSPSVSPSPLSFSSTLRLLVSEMGLSIILLCPFNEVRLPLFAFTTRGRIKGGLEGGEKPSTRTVGGGGMGGEREWSKDWMDVWKSQRGKESESSSISPSFSLFHQLIASIRQIEGGSISLSDRLNNAAAAWLAFHHQPVPSTQILGSSYSHRQVARDDILIQIVSLGKIRERRGNTKTLLQSRGWVKLNFEASSPKKWSHPFREP